MSVQVGADRPQLVALTTLDLRTPLAPYLSLRALSSYSGLSVRTLRDRLTDPRRPLPHYRLPGKLLVKRDEFDAWMARYRRVGRPEIEPKRPLPESGP